MTEFKMMEIFIEFFYFKVLMHFLGRVQNVGNIYRILLF
jgi:hypothetical protein